MGGNYRFTTEQAQRAADRVLKALAAGNKTREQIAATAFLSLSAVSQHILQLRKKKLVRIAAWGPLSGRQRARIYGLGSGRDAAKPKAKTIPERSKDFRAMVKADPVRDMHYRAKARMRKQRQRTTAPVDPLTGWIPRRERREAA